MDQLVRSPEEMKQSFFNMRKDRRKLEIGFYVSAKVRRDFLISQDQGRMILEGRVEPVCFENAGGGVYRAYIQPGFSAL